MSKHEMYMASDVKKQVDAMEIQISELREQIVKIQKEQSRIVSELLGE